MISILTPEGSKNLILRGVLAPSGNKAFAAGTITTPFGDRQFWDNASSLPALTVTASPENPSGAIVAPSGAFSAVTTSATTVSVSGGSAPYSYAWSLVSDDGLGGVWAARQPTSAVCQFRAPLVETETTSMATFRCTVTDARGAIGTVDVYAVATVYKA